MNLLDKNLRNSLYQSMQAWIKGEDMAKTLRLNAVVSGPYGDFEDCLVTKEWTPLDPGAIEHKYYAEGVGLVLVRELHGKTVYVELVDVIPESAMQASPVPEPTVVVLLAVGAMGLIRRRQ